MDRSEVESLQNQINEHKKIEAELTTQIHLIKVSPESGDHTKAVVWHGRDDR